MKYTFITLLLVLIFSDLFSQDTANGIVWHPVVQISPNGIPCYAPIITTQGNVVHITWKFSDGPLHFPYRRSTDGGNSFDTLRELVSIPNPLTAATDYHLLTASESRLYGAWVVGDTSAHYQTMFFQSNDSGTTWGSPILVADSNGGWLFYESCSDTVLLGLAKQNDYRRIFRSSNGGISWAATLPNFNWDAHPQIAMVPGKVFRAFGSSFDSAGHYNEFVVQYKTSTDLGDTWSITSIPLSTIRPRSGQQAYEPKIVSGYDNDTPRVVVSWKDTKYGCLGWGTCSIMERHLIDVNSANWSPERVMTEEPRGWQSANALHNSLMAVAWAIEVPSGNFAYHNVIIRVSKNRGDLWTPPINLTPDSTVSAGNPDVAISNNTIHIVWSQAPYNGLGPFRIYYRRGEILPTRVEENQNEPTTFMLQQNYPNPFNPKTSFEFRVSSLEFITLNVYNIFGQEIATLVNERKEPGTYKAEWNAETFPSGLYFYRLVVKDEKGKTSAATKKMMLQK